MLLATIAIQVVLPIFLVMGLGLLLARRFDLHLETLSKLNFYVFIPIFMLDSLLKFKPGAGEMGQAVLFNVLLMAFLGVASWGVLSAARVPSKLFGPALVGATIFNSANYGIPVVELAFGGKGVALQVITIAAMNVLTYTAGLWIASGWKEWRKGLDAILRLPVLYALVLALILRGLGWMPPKPIASALSWVAAGMVSIALLTLGAQMAKGLSRKHSREVLLTVALRLLAGPVVGWMVLKGMGLSGLTAQVLFVSSAFPTAVITVIFGIEFKKEPAFSADVVFLSTLISLPTVALAIALAPKLFP